jgi:hypothetical protein
MHNGEDPHVWVKEHKAYVIEPDGRRTPVDMRGTVLNTREEVLSWLAAGYLKTHPELEGCRIDVEEEILDRG